MILSMSVSDKTEAASVVAKITEMMKNTYPGLIPERKHSV